MHTAALKHGLAINNDILEHLEAARLVKYAQLSCVSLLLVVLSQLPGRNVAKESFVVELDERFQVEHLANEFLADLLQHNLLLGLHNHIFVLDLVHFEVAQTYVWILIDFHQEVEHPLHSGAHCFAEFVDGLGWISYEAWHAIGTNNLEATFKDLMEEELADRQILTESLKRNLHSHAQNQIFEHDLAEKIRIKLSFFGRSKELSQDILLFLKDVAEARGAARSTVECVYREDEYLEQSHHVLLVLQDEVNGAVL